MSKERALGTNFENLCRDYLNSSELFDGRISREDFSSPLGDLRGTCATIECKDRKSLTLSAFMAQVQKSDTKTGHGMPIVIAKKRNANIRDAYFLTDLEHGAILLRALELCRQNGLL